MPRFEGNERDRARSPVSAGLLVAFRCHFAVVGLFFFTLADFVTLINPISGPGYDLPQLILLASLAFSRRPGCQSKQAEFCTVFGRIRKTAPQAHVGPVVAATAEPDPAPPPRGLKRNLSKLGGIGNIYEPDPAPPPRGLKQPIQSYNRGHGSLITPARKFRMLLHTNPTRERGECLGTRAGALKICEI